MVDDNGDCDDDRYVYGMIYSSLFPDKENGIAEYEMMVEVMKKDSEQTLYCIIWEKLHFKKLNLGYLKDSNKDNE